MKTILGLCVCFTLSLYGYGQVIVQETIGNAGGTYEQASGSLQYNIGETLTETYTESEKGQLYEGFEQGSYSIVTLEEILNNVITAEIYPNPVAHELHINITSDTPQSISCSLEDAQGKLILLTTDIEMNQIIQMSNWTTGSYFLTLYNEDKSYLKKIKLIKQ
ncbi:T9SS type A sorting domain-containing protein [Crocinitomicaceae bacterium]|nr:T9SS type A sorting domain-containing protein [Crocinitomicaceae bacterium]